MNLCDLVVGLGELSREILNAIPLKAIPKVKISRDSFSISSIGLCLLSLH